MKLKKLLVGVTVSALAACMSLTAFAQSKIFVDLQEVTSDTPPQIVNDRMMVPVRAITQMLGYEVNWNEEARQVEVCEKDSTIPIIIMNIDSSVAYYTKYDAELGDYVGVEAELESPATIINNRTFVPLRFISEAVGYIVDYEVDTADVYMFSPNYMINMDGEGKGGDDGMGEAIGLSQVEMTELLDTTTESWLALTQTEKEEVVVLIGRWWETDGNIIIPDYTDMIEKLDHQMEQYHKNGVVIGVFETACDIYSVDVSQFIKG